VGAYTGDPVAFDWTRPDRYVANGQQYGVLSTGTLKAWQTYGFGPHRAVVSDIDTGVMYNHEDLTNMVRHAYSWYGAGGTTTPSDNQQAADPEPIDFRVDYPTQAEGTDVGTANEKHGTHTSGIICAEGGNGVGVAGMCWNVDLVHYKGFSNTGSGYNWGLYGSLYHLAKWKNTRVKDGEGNEGPARYPHAIPVNMSFGGPAASAYALDMLAIALANDIIPVTSSGNDGAGFPVWPAAYPGCISVGAVDYRDRRIQWSNFGSTLSVVAPGINNYSTGGSSNTSYLDMSGTSMSSPHVTGLIGYMLTFNPDLKPDQIKSYIERNAHPLDGQTGFSNVTGWGRIDTFKTIGAVISDMNGGGPPPSNYVGKAVKVKVLSGSGTPLSGANVYLLHCDQTGRMTNYAGVSITGTSWVEHRADATAPSEAGVCWFTGLKPGYYKAMTTTAGYPVVDIGTATTATSDTSTTNPSAANVAYASAVFEVSRSADPPVVELRSPAKPLLIQTLQVTGGSSSVDTRIRICNSLTGYHMINYDSVNLDSYTIALPKVPGTYWIQICSYSTTSAVGPYALWVTTGPSMASPAPGIWSGSAYADIGDGVMGSQTHGVRTMESQLIEINDKVIYGELTTATRTNTSNGGDWYRFEIAADGGGGEGE